MMNDQPQESIEFSDQDQADLAALGIAPGEEPTYHPILHVWKVVLEPAHEEAKAKVTPQYANRIISSYRDISFGDMIAFRDLFYAKIIELEEILLQVIDSDEKCLSYDSPEEDKEKNSHHYRKVLLEWQRRFMEWELAWDTLSPTAALEMAAISEVHNFCFSATGLTAQLQNIQFEYTEQHQAEVAEVLNAMRSDGE